MDWFKKHLDTVMVLGGILGSMMWINSEFNRIKTDLAIIKTVLIMKGIMPETMAKNGKSQEIDIPIEPSKKTTW